MAKPIINKIGVFDAFSDKTITFSCSNISLYYNELIIYEASSLNVVYDRTIQSMRQEHTIPLGCLQNGKSYAAQIRCYDYSKQTVTSLSDYAYFMCLKTPVFQFVGITSNSITVRNSSANVSVEYSQENGEEINYCNFILWNENGQNQLVYSDPIYNNPNASYTFRMLENNTTYQIQVIGVTKNGVSIDTGKKMLYVRYNYDSDYSLLSVESNNNDGIVDYKSNIKILSPDEKMFVYINDTLIDLRDQTLTYSKNFNLESDFAIFLKMYNNRTGMLLTLSNADQFVNLYCLDIGDGVHCRYKLEVLDGDLKYVIYSDEMSFSSDLISLWIKKDDNLYDLIKV